MGWVWLGVCVAWCEWLAVVVGCVLMCLFGLIVLWYAVLILFMVAVG